MVSSPTIAFYGGIGTIGGTKIAVEEGGYRVIFDFGSTYAPGGDFWGGKIQARSGAARLRDMVALGYTPALDGIYHAAGAKSLGLEPGRGDRTQVFISHLHLDHMALVDLLADEVPVWMHTDSLNLFRAVAETGEQPAVPVGARAFEWDQEIKVGPITVTPVAIDHDIPGASALLIKTSAGTVVYTGDLRLHGPEPEKVERFVAAARATNPRILLIEGTRLGELNGPSDRLPTLKEAEVPVRVVEHLQGAPGLGLITLYPRNPLRIENIARVVGSLVRQMLLSPEMAHVYAAMGHDLRAVGLYLRAKDKQALADGTAPDWLTHLAARMPTLDAAAVRAAQSRFLLQLFYWDLPELVDLQPAEGSVCIHSNGEPLGRFDPAFELFTHWLNHYGIPLAWAPSTGHAAPQDLMNVVSGINPAILMPIHSHQPELLQVEGINRTMPEIGAVYDIATGERVM